ncbi:MAG: radical SAM protein [Thermoplasmata archaeon]|nr:radical SAM protein [Thermoplasmata archaeon]
MAEVGVDQTFHLKVKTTEDQSAEYKEYRRRWNENPQDYIVEDFPMHVDLEVNTSCNLKCFMCFQSFDPPAPEKMDTDLFKKVIDEGTKKGLCAIKTQYRGEPLLDKRMPDLVKYAKEKGVLEVMFNTNANLLFEDTAKALIDAGLDKIICSVDGYSKDVYESVRIGGNFETMLTNIQRLQDLKKEMGLTKPVVRVQMVDTPRNHHQIDEYIKFWGAIVENIAIEDMLDWEANEEDPTPLDNWACGQIWQRLLVLADGDVLPCCRGMKGATEKLMVLGNAHDISLEEIWKGEKLEALRKLHREGRSHEIKMCRLCGMRKEIINRENTK